jgi:Zn-dependent membrane protease YugP
MLMFDPRYLLFVGPAILIAIYAQMRVSTTFAKFSRVLARSGYSGAQAARAILHGAGLEVDVEPTGGRLSDHYDPRTRSLRLSEQVFGGRSLAALGVAAHEAGHAVQHAVGYAPMALRNMVAPAFGLGQSVAWILFVLGLLLSHPVMINVGILLFSGVVAFYVITLPVELNASRRAMALLTSQGILTPDEAPGARAVLNAAALTYVAAALQAILTLLYMLSRRR